MTLFAISALVAIFLLTLLNSLRFKSVLKTLLFRIRQQDPDWYERIDGEHFFSGPANDNKQLSLFNYIALNRFENHPDPIIVQKCRRLQTLFKRCMRCLTLLFSYICLLLIYVGSH